MTKQAKTNNLNYLIDATFNKFNRLFFLSFENEDDRTSFSKYYTPSVEMKAFNVLIDRKKFFDVPTKSKEQRHETNTEISKYNDYTTGNLLDYDFFSKHYQLIAMDLIKQIELENPDLRQQTNFVGKPNKDIGVRMFFIIEKSGKTTFNFSQNPVRIYKMETQKIISLLNGSSYEESKFVTKIWYVIDSQTAKGKCNQNNSIKFETESIKQVFVITLMHLF